MTAQWTAQDPGAGSLYSLSSLADQLNSTALGLDGGRDRVDACLNVFADDWIGVAASAAKLRIDAVHKEMRTCIDAALQAKTAIEGYVEVVSEIKRLAAQERLALDTAEEDRRGILSEMASVLPLSSSVESLPDRRRLAAALQASEAARSAAEDALDLLATRRRAADLILLRSLRATVATNWDVPPGDYPMEEHPSRQTPYSYDKKHRIDAQPEEHSIEELMELFKAHPAEAFPFPVEGDGEVFTDGAIFRLRDMIMRDGMNMPFETGYVVVTTGSTSVKFTVISDEYFDEPGSTIEFSIVESDGQYYIRKLAQAEKSIPGSNPFASWFAESTWAEQAENFNEVVRKYG